MKFDPWEPFKNSFPKLGKHETQGFFVCDLILWNIKEDIYPPAPKHLLSLNCANVHFVCAYICVYVHDVYVWEAGAPSGV